MRRDMSFIMTLSWSDSDSVKPASACVMRFRSAELEFGKLFWQDRSSSWKRFRPVVSVRFADAIPPT
jgi:hypothetical protein